MTYSTIPSPLTGMSSFTVWRVLIDDGWIDSIKSSSMNVRQNDAPLSIITGSKLLVRNTLFLDIAALSQINLLAATTLDLTL